MTPKSARAGKDPAKARERDPHEGGRESEGEVPRPEANGSPSQSDPGLCHTGSSDVTMPGIPYSAFDVVFSRTQIKKKKTLRRPPTECFPEVKKNRGAEWGGGETCFRLNRCYQPFANHTNTAQGRER